MKPTIARRARVGVVAAAATALLAATTTGAGATTTPASIKMIRVDVTDSRVAINVKRIQRGMIAQFVVINRSSKPRIFFVGDRRTARIRPGQRDILLLHMDVRRPVPYRVHGERSPAFRGLIQVL